MRITILLPVVIKIISVPVILGASIIDGHFEAGVVCLIVAAALDDALNFYL